MTNYHSQVVNHPHPEVVCCDTNSSSKLSHREDDICKGLGYVLSMQGAVFIPTACDSSSPMCIKNGGILSYRIEATFHTKGSGSAITMSRYHLLALAFCAGTFNCLQTNTPYDCIYKSAFYFVSSESLFAKMSASRLLLAHR